MRFAHINVRSLLNNFDNLKQHVFENDYNIIGITESWLNSDIDDEVTSLNGYYFVRQDRETRGGGVGLYIGSNLEFNVLRSECTDVIEHIWIRVRIENKSVIVGNIYRPPGSSCQEFLSYFEDLLIEFYADCDYISCLGDFNINMLDIDSSYVTHFNDILGTFGLTQMVNEPTRVSNTTSTLIDLICCNPDMVNEVGVIDPSVSDHFLVYVDLDFSDIQQPNSIFKYRVLSRINLNQFQTDLENAPWHLLYQIEDIDHKVLFLTETIMNIFDKHAPLKVSKDRRKPYCPWITDNIKLMKKLRNQALGRFKRTGNPAHRDYYKQLRNVTTNAIRAEKRAYLNLKFQNCSSKEKWSELRKLNIIKNKNRSIPIHLKNVEDLNVFFTEVSQNNSTPKDELLNRYKNNSFLNDTFHFMQTDEDTVSKIILNIKTKAFGADNLNITLISLCCPFIVPFITHIVNRCIGQSYFPDCWKLANVVPLAKVNNPTELGQLRSISILPTLSKILEKIMETQIATYVFTNKIIPLKQSGFRRGYSCSAALSDVVDDVVRARDCGDATVLMLLDYSKAFDMINHSILIAILEYIGFQTSAASLVSSFLSNRKQRVCLDGEISETRAVESGVPQGSILGPLLYSIYTFNFVNSLDHCQYHLYADDTQIYTSFKPSMPKAAESKINSDLEKILKISEDHLLKINPNKSTAILFCHDSHRKQLESSIKLRIGNNAIPFGRSAKDLGLIIDSKLKFREHISLCLKRAYSMLKLIYAHRFCLSQKTKAVLCESLVLSHFNFADHVYGPFLDCIDIKRVQKAQNSCLRLIFGIRRRQRISHKLPELGWLNMSQRRELHSICFFYKLVKFKCPPYLHQKIKFRTDVHNLNIRRLNLITIPAHNMELFKRSFSYQIALLLNKFNVKEVSLSVAAFKNKIKGTLLSQSI